uniref:hypothetical protein n=1 Tax=Streptomyces sp. CA-136453 TaxID=3240050 RepID=UPI003F490E75
MEFRISGGSAEFERDLLALLARHQDVLSIEADREWTADRAESFLRTATPLARNLAVDVITHHGFVRATTLRERGHDLKAASSAVTKTVTRGVREKLWPEGMPRPLHPEYDPERISWQQVQGYRMEAAVLEAFRTAYVRRGGQFKAINTDRENGS